MKNMPYPPHVLNHQHSGKLLQLRENHPKLFGQHFTDVNPSIGQNIYRANYNGKIQLFLKVDESGTDALFRACNAKGEVIDENYVDDSELYCFNPFKPV